MPSRGASGARVSAILKAIGHPTRLRILERIAERGLCVSDLEEALGLRQANVSQHLAVLRDRGLVIAERRGNTTCYYLADPRIAEVITLMRDMLSREAEAEAVK